MENKAKILKEFLIALQSTRGADDLENMRLLRNKITGDELVMLEFRNGHKKAVNVTGDSGCAMMRDILKEF